MDYKDYDLISFLKDEEFKKWVIHPIDSSNMFWQEFLKAHPEKKADFQKARQIILSLEFEEFDEQNNDVKYEMFRKILQGQKSERGKVHLTNKVVKPGSKQIALIYKIAASFLLLAGLAFLFMTNQKDQITGELVISQLSKENPRGRKSTIHLPDGSIVKLNSESSITYPQQFDSSKRVIYLTGEAFFEVAENPDWPFSVVTGNIITTALGTSFNVQAWHRDKTINISLAEGKVLVARLNSATKDQNYFLNPGEKIVHKIDTDEFIISEFNIMEEFGWKDGIIVFNRSNLPEFTNKLSRWYDVEFEVNGTQKEPWSIDGRFENKSLKDILESLSYTYKIGYKLEDKKVTLYL